MLLLWLSVWVTCALALNSTFVWNSKGSHEDNAELLAIYIAEAHAQPEFSVVVEKAGEEGSEKGKVKEKKGKPEKNGKHEKNGKSEKNDKVHHVKIQDKRGDLQFHSRFLPHLNNGTSTFLVLCRNEEVYELLETIQSIQDRYNHKFHHDWVFLNDEQFSDQFIILVSSFIKKGKLSFGQVPGSQWLYPDFIDQELAAQKRKELAQKNVVYAESELYRHMCRYYLGFFQHHVLLQPYDYYWRVEPGVKFYCDIDYNVFDLMRAQGKVYGFVLSMFEYRDTIPLLWGTTQEYFEMKRKKNLNEKLVDNFDNDFNIDPKSNTNSGVSDSNLLEFVENSDGTYNLCHFWLNFEVALLAFFRSKEYMDYFNHLDELGGFFYERWGDAPVHTLAIAHLLSPSEIWWFEDMGYFHLPYTHCPLGPKYVEKKCACDQSMDFSFTDMSCTPHMLNILMKHEMNRPNKKGEGNN